MNVFHRYSSWNSSHKEKKEEEKTHQGKYSKHPHSSSKDFKHSSSKDHKTCSSSRAKTRAPPSSSPKLKIEGKTNSIKCFKCLGYGHKAFNCPNQRVIVLKNGELKLKTLIIIPFLLHLLL